MLKKKKTVTKDDTKTSEHGEKVESDDNEKSEGKVEPTEKNVRLFHDDTFKGFFRRLSWSNDGTNP